MRGPNYWSIRRQKLIVMLLDLEEMEERPSHKVDGFYERITTLLPGMYEHRCSLGVPGGFFERLKKGTWMGHIIEHVALEIQTMAGMNCGFGRTREADKIGVYNVVFSYEEESVGIYAAKAALRMVESVIAGKDYDLEPDIQAMRELREDDRLGPSTGSIVEEAKTRDIPYIRLNKHSLVQLGYGVNQKRIRATISGQTSNIAVDLACDKEETKDLLEQTGVPVPKGYILRQESTLKEILEKVSFPIVIKPVDGNHGKGATIDINSEEEALVAFHVAKQFSRRVIVENFIKGFDFRLLVINHKFVAAAKRTPAHVIGDGKSSVEQLIAKVNSDPRRGFGHENVLTEITVNQMTERILESNGLTLESVLPKSEVLHLKSTANLSTGGTSMDVTDDVHPFNVFMAERVSRVIGLDICGIDVMATDITKPITDVKGAVLEVNAAPGFRMHLDPTDGLPRNVAEPVVDMLYPPGSTSRVPIVAVTGTNGKTTTVRLIAHIMQNARKKVGFTTSDGIYIQNRMLQSGDCSGPKSSEFVLKDPTIDFAVLECARGGMLRSGLGFSQCDVGVVTNVAADHLGLKGINTIEQLARVKAIVPETVARDGYAVLNADDELVITMRKSLQCNVALFSMNEKNKMVNEHCKNGGVAAIYENGFITIKKGNWKTRIEKVGNIPLTFDGTAVFMIQNVLPAVLAGFLQGVKIEELKLGLQTFIPSPTQTPGRMNLIEFQNFKVMIDFAHNPAGLKAVGKYLEKVDAKEKIGIIAGTGDRRDEDIIEFGALSAQFFDKLVIRQDKHLRGRTAEEIIGLLKKGIEQEKKGIPVEIFYKEKEAIVNTLTNAIQGSFITVLCDTVPDALNTVIQMKEKESDRKILKSDIPNLN